MTIGITSRVGIRCDGSTKVFPIPIQAYQATDFTVILTAPVSAGGSQALLALNSDYSLAPFGSLQPPQWTLTTLATAAYASGYTLQVFPNPVQSQQTQYTQGRAFPSLALQTNIDRLTQMVQRLQDQLSRSVRAPDGDVSPGTRLPAAVSRQSMYLATDGKGNVIATAALPGTANTQASLGPILYPQTAAETAAGVTVVNSIFPPGWVERYGTNATPGTTDMTAAVQAAMNVAKQSGGPVYIGATGTCLVTAPIDCTTAGNSLLNMGWRVVNLGNLFPQPPPGSGGIQDYGIIHARHNGYTVFDCTGSFRISWENISVTSDNVTYPKTCWFLARANVGTFGNSMYHVFTKTFVVGYFSIAVLYNYGSEDGDYIANHWYNYATDAGACVVVLTANNYFKGTTNFLNSSFTAMHRGVASCIGHKFFGGEYALGNTSTTGDNFYLEGFVASFQLYGGWMMNTAFGNGTTNGRSLVYNDTTNGGCAYCLIDGLKSENSTTLPRYGVEFGPAAATPVFFSIRDSYINVTTHSVAAVASVTGSGFVFQGISELSGKGINWPGTLEDSTIDWKTSVTIGVSLRNLIKNTLGNITITTNTNSIFMDIGGGAVYAKGALGMSGVTGASQLTGWGTPTNGSVVNNFPGSGATLSQCGQAITEIIIQLKALGLFGA